MTKSFSLKLLRDYNYLKCSNILLKLDNKIKVYISITHSITLRMYEGM